MQQTLYVNIKYLINIRKKSSELRGKELENLPVLKDAFLFIEDGVIKDYGLMRDILVSGYQSATETVDVANASVLPCWCDSHTHLIFAASRENEFIDRIKGLSYADIAAKGGGILNSAKKLNETSEEVLYIQALQRLNEVIQLGTGAIEIKSGYGLSTDDEIKMLRVIKELRHHSPIPIKATFFAAHAFPEKYKNNHKDYIDLIINEMLPKIAEENLADYIDVFCEEGFFNVKETEQICRAGIEYGLTPKIHSNQLSLSGGTQIGVKLNAISVDHLETMDEDAIETLSNSQTIGTLLPTAAYFLRMNFPPARKLIEAGCAIALASDFNPGTSPSGNMNTVVSMSCIQMKMLPEEAINAATINGAYAMNLGNEVGSITIGKKANLIFTKNISSIAYIPYSFGTNLIDKVMIDGKFISE